VRTSDWLADFSRLSRIFLGQNGEDIADFVGPRHASTLNALEEALSDKKKSEAHKLVKEKKDEFRGLPVKDRLSKIEEGEKKRSERYPTRPGLLEIKCPSCEGPALSVGSLVRSTTPKHKGGELIQEDIWLPIGLVCYSCGLKITEHAHMHGIGCGDQFVTTDFLDPTDYYDFGQEASFEDEYGND